MRCWFLLGIIAIFAAGSSAQIFMLPSVFATVWQVMGEKSARKATGTQQHIGNQLSYLGKRGRFQQLGNQSPPQLADDDELKRRQMVFHEGQGLRRDALLARAAKKRQLAKNLLAAAERAKDYLKSLSKRIAVGKEAEYEKAEANMEYLANKRKARMMEFQADNLEDTAKEIEISLKKMNKPHNAPQCDIMKIGPVKFAPMVDEITNLLQETTMAQLAGDTLTIYYQKRPKLTYLLDAVDIPIRNLPNSDSCLGFKYHQVEQVLCAEDKSGRDGWINALTEAWFCRNFGLRGMMPSIEAAEQEMEEESKTITPPPTTETTTPGPLVDIDIGIKKDGSPAAKINGKSPFGK